MPPPPPPGPPLVPCQQRCACTPPEQGPSSSPPPSLGLQAGSPSKVHSLWNKGSIVFSLHLPSLYCLMDAGTFKPR